MVNVDVLDNISKLSLKDSFEVCSCNGITIGDIKNKLNKTTGFISFVRFQEISDCGDVCELCVNKKPNSKKHKISLEELYSMEDVK